MPFELDFEVNIKKLLLKGCLSFASSHVPIKSSIFFLVCIFKPACWDVHLFG